ncbi:DUF6090 family protein [Flagellimonas crocea]|uniref:DUF6090 family protein n=1 Tax=Flagellimonas crocea TaxID=3067311 RepID=UPI00296FC066|nr:DUF6090 family protein [Muricauda sp. DH64]
MITVFRKIRQRLLSEGKVSKYLKYALGEIILVVIGILIALQVNDWNENNKSDTFEKEMLTQIQENLESDKFSLERIHYNFENAISSIDKILVNQHRKYPDSLPFWLGHIVQFERFAPITNSYETLKSKGLDKLSDKELRLLLSNYYENNITKVGRSIIDIEYSFLNDWKPFLQETPLIDFKFQKYVILADPSIFDSHSVARNNLILNRDNYAGGAQHISTVLNSIEALENKLAMIMEQ